MKAQNKKIEKYKRSIIVHEYDEGKSVYLPIERGFALFVPVMANGQWKEYLLERYPQLDTRKDKEAIFVSISTALSGTSIRYEVI